MLKKVGMIALMLSAAGAVLPVTALAQDGYYGSRRDYYYQNDRHRDRHEAHEWREREHRERRAEEWRERAWRNHAWREHRGWDRDYYRQYPPDAYSYYGYRQY